MRARNREKIVYNRAFNRPETVYCTHIYVRTRTHTHNNNIYYIKLIGLESHGEKSMYGMKY